MVQHHQRHGLFRSSSDQLFLVSLFPSQGDRPSWRFGSASLRLMVVEKLESRLVWGHITGEVAGLVCYIHNAIVI
jgi:hypothetical protein